MSMHVPFIGFRPSLKVEFFLPIVTFVMLQIYAIYSLIRNNYLPVHDHVNNIKRFDDFVKKKTMLFTSISILISIAYFVFGVIIFYMAYSGARVRGTLINMGE